jgi:hypothetical protein
MRKRIRLTESELINLVQRIIEEDEMMDAEMSSSKGFTIADVYKKSGYGGKLPSRLTITKLKGKINVDGVDKTLGSINTTSKIICQGNCEIEFKDVPSFGEMFLSVKMGVPSIHLVTQ